MATLFIDEAGYTGGNLLDPEQPVFALASIMIEEVEAKELKAQFFYKVKAAELKYSSIKKKYRPALFDFLNYLHVRPEIVKFTIVAKRYALLGKILDLFVEPSMRRSGLDLYERGGNIAFANLLYTILPVLEGEDFFDEVLSTFQRMMASRSLYDYAVFFGTVLHHEYRDQANTFMGAMFAGQRDVGLSVFTAPKDTLNLAVGQALVLVNLWRQSLGEGEPMDVVHDRSSQMQLYKTRWDKFAGPNVPRQSVGYDRRAYQFPLSVEKTIPDGESKNWAGLQLADVLAGSARDFANGLLRKGSDPDFESQLESILNGKPFNIHGVWPSQDITPEALGTSGGGTSYEGFYKVWEDASR